MRFRKISGIFLALIMLMSLLSVGELTAMADETEYCYLNMYFDTDAEYPIGSQQVVKGNAPVKPEDPALTGMAFLGWYADKAFSVPYDFSAPLYEDADMYARFVDSDEAVGVCFFMGPDEDYPYMDQLLKKGELVTRPLDPFVEEKVFAGWYSDRGLENKYDFSKPVEDYLNLFARFVTEDECYSVLVFLTAEDEFQTTGYSVPKGEPCSMPAEPALPGKVFAGWYTDRALTQPADFTSPRTEDISLFGKWADGYTWTEAPSEWSGAGSLEFVVKGPGEEDISFKKFRGVTMDGAAVDESNYTAEEGSVRLTLKEEYLETLSPGEHTLGLLFSDDVSVETKFTIKGDSATYNITVIGGGKAYSNKAKTDVITEAAEGDIIYVGYDEPAEGRYVADVRFYEGESLHIEDWDGGLAMPAHDVVFEIVTADRMTYTVDLTSGSASIPEEVYVYNVPWGSVGIPLPEGTKNIDLDGSGRNDIAVTWSIGDPAAAAVTHADRDVTGSYTVNVTATNTPYSAVIYKFGAAPASGNGSKIPNTGDGSHAEAWLGLTAVSFIGLICSAAVGKKYRVHR